MALRFYNTLTKKKKVFKPQRKREVRMYHCGPTVYSYAHIGNFRAYVFADLLRRYLEWKGFTVKQIMNITDVGHMTVDSQLQEQGEDKIEAAARRAGRSPKEIADFYTMAFFEDIEKLNLKKAYFYPRATDHIGEMEDLIASLLKKRMAYRRGGNVYFEIKRFPSYGKLSGNTLEKLQAGKRIKVISEKRSPFDFALWIHNPKHLMQWASPWSKGYPGWHIECSAMSMAYLGESIDIHTGGEDNIFPHHECEIAQSEGVTGKEFVRYWLHTRHLFVNGKKMSKRLGNFYTLRDLLKKGFNPLEIRFLLLSAHYRTRLNFTEKGVRDARVALDSLGNVILSLKGVKKGKGNKKIPALIRGVKKDFEQAMDDDLNIAKGLSHLFRFVREVNGLIAKGGIGKKNAKGVLEFLFDLDRILGLELEKSPAPLKIPAEIKQLLEKREELRKEKKWKEADKIRNQLRARGFLVEDTKKGPKLRKREK